MIPQNERWKCDAHDDRIQQCTVILDWYDQLVMLRSTSSVPVANVAQLLSCYLARLKRSITVPVTDVRQFLSI